jgi:hypothetical protein
MERGNYRECLLLRSRVLSDELIETRLSLWQGHQVFQETSSPSPLWWYGLARETASCHLECHRIDDPGFGQSSTLEQMGSHELERKHQLLKCENCSRLKSLFHALPRHNVFKQSRYCGYKLLKRQFLDMRNTLAIQRFINRFKSLLRLNNAKARVPWPNYRSAISHVDISSSMFRVGFVAKAMYRLSKRSCQ